MDISIGIYPNEKPAAIINSGRLADAMGFAGLWVLDSHLLFREPYTLLGALAVSTRRIRLGTAVTNPLTRHPTVTASAFSTLAELSDGRAVLGISIGDSALRSMGLDVATMSTLAETISVCRKLLAGEVVSFGAGGSGQLSHTGRAVPIYVAASGPKMLNLAGRIADGVILMNGVAPELVDAAIRMVRDGEQMADREPGSVKIAVWAACHTDPEAVKFNVARAILRTLPGPRDELTRATAAKIAHAYDYSQHGSAQADFARLIPGEIVPRFAFCGAASAIAGQIEALAPGGVDEVILAVPVAPEIASREAVMREICPLVLPNGCDRAHGQETYDRS